MFVGLLYVWYKLVEQRGLLEMSTCPSFRLSVFTQTRLIFSELIILAVLCMYCIHMYVCVSGVSHFVDLIR